uniref:Iron-binding zinc finger CDGSH type domain-containing protein n=1 Tax=Arcella intermedia TaxID=1963864 RepID=A0A6B2LSV0_9EUKA
MEKGKSYYWCSCGLSKKQPFCDGAHSKTNGLKPLKFEVQETKKYLLCGCKQTSNQPFCDMTHLSVIAKGIFGKNDNVMSDQRRAEIEQTLQKPSN